MLFKKEVEGVKKITDVNPPFEIAHTYFKIKESEYPFGSLLFKRLLESHQVIVLALDDCKGDLRTYLSKFLFVDKKWEEVKQEETKKSEEKKKEEMKEEKKRERKKKTEEKKIQKVKEVAEKKRKENVIIISDDEVEESVAKHLLG